LRLCERCRELTSGPCRRCDDLDAIALSLEDRWHRRRAAALYESLPRVEAETPRPPAPWPSWLWNLRGWLRVGAAVLFEWALFFLAAAAFWWAGKAALHELHH
jgi:hypothetical protein